MASDIMQEDDLGKEKEEVQEEALPLEVECDLELKTILVKLKKPGSALSWECELRELIGNTRDTYLERQSKMGDMKTGVMRNFKDLHSYLLALTLWDLETKKTVPVEDIRNFPASVQTRLFKLSVKLSDLDDKAEERAKNA